MIEILPAVHALTGCDTTSKVWTKVSALKAARKYGHELLCSFGKDNISEEMVVNAELFLLKCISSSSVDTFNELRFQVYHKKQYEFVIEKLPATT